MDNHLTSRTIKLIIKDSNCTDDLMVNLKKLSNKMDYFNSLTNFQENIMDEIIINVPNSKITKMIIESLILNFTLSCPITKKLIECYDFLLLSYDNLLDEISNFEELLDVCDKFGYTESRIKIISKKIPKEYDTKFFPDQLIKLINYYQQKDRYISISKGNLVKIWDSDTRKRNK